MSAKHCIIQLMHIRFNWFCVEKNNWFHRVNQNIYIPENICDIGEKWNGGKTLHIIQVMHICSDQFCIGKYNWSHRFNFSIKIYPRKYLQHRWEMKYKQNTAYYTDDTYLFYPIPYGKNYWSCRFEFAILISEIICDMGEKWNFSKTLYIIQLMHIRSNQFHMGKNDLKIWICNQNTYISENIYNIGEKWNVSKILYII